MSERKTDDTTEREGGNLPASPYWEDAVYRYLCRSASGPEKEAGEVSHGRKAWMLS